MSWYSSNIEPKVRVTWCGETKQWYAHKGNVGECGNTIVAAQKNLARKLRRLHK